MGPEWCTRLHAKRGPDDGANPMVMTVQLVSAISGYFSDKSGALPWEVGNAVMVEPAMTVAVEDGADWTVVAKHDTDNTVFFHVTETTRENYETLRAALVEPEIGPDNRPTHKRAGYIDLEGFQLVEQTMRYDDFIRYARWSVDGSSIVKSVREKPQRRRRKRNGR